MSESGVIPPPEERSAHKRYHEIGRVKDGDGYQITVGIDGWGRIEIGHSSTALSVRLDQDQAEQFAQLYIRACWEATMPP